MSSSFTKADIAAMAPALREALGMAAFGLDRYSQRKALQTLAKHGLVDEYEDVLPGSADGSVIGRLPVTVKRFSVPIHVHIAYCEWASDEVQWLGEAG